VRALKDAAPGDLMLVTAAACRTHLALATVSIGEFSATTPFVVLGTYGGDNSRAQQQSF
jgi:hypothetical protein